MANTVGSTPLIITIAEKLGTAVGTIVAKTSDVVEGATKSLQGPTPNPRAQKTARSRKARVPKPKPSTMKKKVARAATGKTHTRKRAAKK